MLGNSPQSLALGQLGADFINDTAAHTGSWGAIYCIVACSFTTLTSAVFLTQVPDAQSPVMAGSLNQITLSPGMCIWGSFTTITLAEGKVIAYHL
jgi:hypothetical protein